MSAARLLAVLKVLFFLSGFTGLTFEVLWTRQLSNVVGATSVAMTCVFSVFIVCLSLGALIASRLRIYDRQALVVYGVLEMAVGVLGFAITMVMLRADVTLARWVPLTATNWDIVIQMGATFVLIGLPTTLMGATLPVVMNAIRSKALPSAQVAGIYGANVIGGASGALACGFLLLWKLGVTGTALFAMIAVVAVGSAAVLLSRQLPRSTGEADEARAEAPAARGASPWLYPTLAFLTGLFALSYELLWGRIAKLFMGDRTMATSTLLFIYLACMALGSFAAGHLHRRHPPASTAAGLGRFGSMLALAAATHLLGVRLVHHVLDTPALAERLAGSVWPRVWTTCAATAIPVVVLGMAFPFLMQTARRIDERPGSAVGVLYFINSVGSGVGAVFGGFLAPRTLGTLSGFVVTSALTVVVALACLMAAGGNAFRRVTRAVVAVGLVVGAVLAMPADLLFYDEGQRLISWNEDEYGVQLMTRSDADGEMFVKSNRLYVAYTLGPWVTNFTQETISYESCLLAERCETVLNIGTGYGITAGAFTVLDAPTELTTIEILPYVCELQPTFAEYNFAYFSDPRVTRLCTEGRRVLAATDRRFDVISVNVLDPYVPGSSSLFTIDFWELARERLASGGVYSQLIWGPDAERLLAGLRAVFPVVLQFPGGWKDTYNVVAFPVEREPELHLERLTDRAREAMLRFPPVDDVDAFFTETLEVARQLDRLARTVPAPSLTLHTDDMPILEYMWARGDDLTDTYQQYRETSPFDSLTVKP